MRLLYVTSTYPSGSGEEFLEAELEILGERGHRTVVVPVNPQRGGLRGVHGSVRAVVRRLVAPAVLADAVREAVRRPRDTAAAIRWLIGGSSPRAAVKNLAVMPKGLWAARLARRLEVQHVHAYWASTPATVASVVSSLTGIPWSFTAHRGDLGADDLVARKVTSAVVVRAVSRTTASRVLDLVGGPSDKVRVGHIGVRVDVPAATGCAQVREVILCAAQLFPRKRHDVLLEAFAGAHRAAPHARLWLAGEGPERQRLEDLATSLGVAGAVRFLGQVRHDDLLRLMDTAPICAVVLASSDEGIPVSLMEAMARAIPAVGTDVGGVAELLGDGCGMLIPTGDAGALAAVLIGLLTGDERYAAVGHRGRLRVHEQFNVRRSVDQLLSWVGPRSEDMAGGDRPASVPGGSGPAAVEAVKRSPCSNR